MADFFDREAVSSEGSEDDEVREEIRRHKKLKKVHAGGGSDEDSEEEEEDDDEKIAQEMKDLINDDVEEEEEEDDDGDSEDGIGRGHKRSHDDDDLEEDLEDDDYDLLEENLGRRIERKKKFRRVRQLEDDDDDEDDENPANTLNERDAIANELFDDDDGFGSNNNNNLNNDQQQQQQLNRQQNRIREQIDDQYGQIDSEHSDESDDEDNFIVDDNDQPIITQKRSKRHDGFNNQALQQAQDIFGVDFDFDVFDDNVEFDEEEMEEDYDEEGIDRQRQTSKKKRQRQPKKSIYELYEPAELERSHLTEADNEIRNTDAPERFLTRSIPVTSAEPNEIREESEWIYRNLYELPTITRQDNHSGSGGIRQPLAGSKPRSTINIISNILKYIRNEQLSIPFLSYYRKEYYAPDLSINDLWLIFNWDEKWCRLNERKKNLLKLMENMKEYQLSLMIKNSTTEDGDNIDDDQPLPDDFRRITDKDLQRIQTIQSFEEFNDYYLQFQLYYSHQLTEMKKYLLKQKRQQRERKRQQRLQERQQQRVNENGENDDPNDEIINEELNEDNDNDDDDEKEELMLTERMNFMRLSMKKDTYSFCRDSGIGRLASKFGLTPEQFGEHITESYHKHEIEQHPINPLEAAQEYLNKCFDTPDKVLQAATFMVGKQLSCDPLVRKTVRQMFYERATVTVRPTKKGKKEIDESHQCYSMKYLKQKPISSFSNEQFLQLNMGKNDGLVDIIIELDDNSTTSSSMQKHHSSTTMSSSSSSMLNNNNNDSKAFKQYLEEIKYLYQRDEFSKNVQDWNDQRTKALDIALNRFLYPFLLKELTTKILTESQHTIIQNCADKLASYLSIGPYIPAFIQDKKNRNHNHSGDDDDDDDDNDDDFDTRNGIRIMGFAFVPNNEEASFCALIDGDGEVTDYIKLEHFMLKRSEGGFLSDIERNLREKDRQKLQNFILTKKPHVIALGADTLVTKDVMDDLTQMIRNLHEIQRLPLIPIEYIDSELSIVYMNSKRAITDFHNYPPKLRQAISLARRLQDPLLEFAQLCSADEEILCLKLHPLQDNVPRETLLNAIYSEFVNRVNEVGVDINKCLVHPYTSSLVQFIGGLGPRKGAYLLRTLKKQQTPLLESRSQLIQNCSIGKNVFINCAGFIKIDTNSFADSGTETYIEVLDSTRVHPETYEWARKMAVDALDYDEDNDHNPAQALEEIIENPEKLRDLDLDEFAKELHRQGLGLKKQTLYDIRTELTDRYQDKRKSYRSPNDEEIFELLTGENLQTFCIGKYVQVRVTGIARRKPKTEQVDQAQPIRMETGLWKCPFCLKDDFNELGEVWNHFDTNQCPGQSFGVRVRLDNGLTGIIPLKYLSDKDVTDPLTRVKVGMTINCRILKIIIERFSLELTCRTSDLIDSNNRFKPNKDNYYDFDSEEYDIRLEEDGKKRKNHQRTYMKRIIVHPSFHNIDLKKSEQILSASPQGEAVIRPSSKGNDHLTLSWKVHDGIYQNVLIREEGKTNPFSLGQQLFIDQESFEDLDEIIARYVQPMASFARDLINFKYFRDLNGDRQAAEKVLNEEKQKAPSRIPYIVSASKEFPGKFLLSYQPNQKAFHELITVTPDGFKYRMNVFKSIFQLFKWFKDHYKDYSTITTMITPGQQQTPINASPYVKQHQHQQRTPQSSTTSPYVNVTGHPGGTTTATFNGNFATAAAAASNTAIAQSLTASVASGGSTFQRPNLYPIPLSATTTAVGAGGIGMGVGGGGNIPSYATGQTMMPPPPPPPPSIPQIQNQRPGQRGGNQWSDLLKQQSTITQDWNSNRNNNINHHHNRTMTSTTSLQIPPLLQSSLSSITAQHQQQQQQSSMPTIQPSISLGLINKPRTPGYSTPGASSQMSISPMQDDQQSTPNIIKGGGDQTPLVDEWN
uniref:Transcription elongation factor SPT6-like n=1 Tax=Dermatophagoides pteronyssinus TaxID=6956 RepID=A0A6P6Y8D0_DERPT|nr:transcription elongation factor SPT6-like [Dermatophagoides pteronyssinus]